jgi:hypothetical protein
MDRRRTQRKSVGEIHGSIAQRHRIQLRPRTAALPRYLQYYNFYIVTPR